MYEEIKKYLEIQFFLKVFQLVVSSKVCPETTPEQWLKTLSYMHEKDWLYYGKEEGKLVTVVGAYRVKEHKDNFDKLPEKEEGKILYIAFMSSIAKDKTLPGKMLADYIKANEVDKIIYHKGNNDENIKSYNLRR